MLKSAYSLLGAALVAVSASFAATAGELSVVGTGDGLEMLRALAATYSEQSDTKVIIPDSIGSGGGIAAVSAGTERLARVARPLKETEVAAGLVYTPFVKIPSVFFVHESAGVSGLTSDQIARIYAGDVKSWAEVGGNDVRVRVVRREDGDSTLQVLRASMPGWSDLEITARSKLAVTTQEAVETVLTEEGAIGFGPYSETFNRPTVILDVDGMGPTDPSYPSAVEIAFVYKDGALDADMEAFMAFSRSEPASKILTDHGGIAIAD